MFGRKEFKEKIADLDKKEADLDKQKYPTDFQIEQQKLLDERFRVQDEHLTNSWKFWKK